MERAHPAYMETLREEWEEDAASEDFEYDIEAQADIQLPVSTKALRMTRPDTGKVCCPSQLQASVHGISCTRGCIQTKQDLHVN